LANGSRGDGPGEAPFFHRAKGMDIKLFGARDLGVREFLTKPSA
jgi:hypothetical protein